MSIIKGQIIIVVVILLTGFFVLTMLIYFLTSSQLKISYDILANTQALLGADMGLDCYFYLEAEGIYGLNRGIGSCNSLCLFATNLNSNCTFGNIKFKVTTSSSNILSSYGIFKNQIFRVLEAKEILGP